jgi:hypothetical protein
MLGCAVTIAIGIGCGDGGTVECSDAQRECDGECIQIEPTLASIQANVFDVSCTASSCHDAGNPQAELQLTSVEVSRANLVGVPSEQRPELPRVMPSEADVSYLMNKLDGVNLAPGTEPMPQIGGPLCDARTEAIREWIELGAP